MKADVLIGLQWGDEGKGKIVDVLTPDYQIIGRFQGGPNAGHTLEFNGIKHVLHTIPSGIFRQGIANLVGNGVVVDPIVLRKEIIAIQKLGVDVYKQLLISRRAQLILPTHRLLDAASETSKGKNKIGSTLKGIGPAYMDKTGRNGLRVGDVFEPDFMQKYQTLKEKHVKMLSHYSFEYNLNEFEPDWLESIEFLKGLPVVDSEYYINEALNAGKKVLAEGAQGTMLDVDFGTYPFVTSSNTVTAGTCTGLGIPPNRIGDVIGIFKAYCTRVGGGPFPTELLDDTGEAMRKAGNEFGSTTGRPRRCGWLDLPALRYAVMINGVTRLAMMKADVLSIFSTIKVCTHYQMDGQVYNSLPYNIVDKTIKPVYTELPGWNCDLTEIDHEDQMPEALVQYIRYIEKELGIPVWIVSVGPDRRQTLLRNAVPA